MSNNEVYLCLPLRRYLVLKSLWWDQEKSSKQRFLLLSLFLFPLPLLFECSRNKLKEGEHWDCSFSWNRDLYLSQGVWIYNPLNISKSNSLLCFISVTRLQLLYVKLCIGPVLFLRLNLKSRYIYIPCSCPVPD